MIIKNPEGAVDARRNLSALIGTARIDVTVDVIVDQRAPTEVISEVSKHADLVPMGRPTPDPEFRERLEQLMSETRTLPAVAYILASTEAELDDILQ